LRRKTRKKIKIWLDVNVPLIIAEFLSRRGYDVVCLAKDEKLRRLENSEIDKLIRERLKRESIVLITTDSDFVRRDIPSIYIEQKERPEEMLELFRRHYAKAIRLACRRKRCVLIQS